MSGNESKSYGMYERDVLRHFDGDLSVGLMPDASIESAREHCLRLARIIDRKIIKDECGHVASQSQYNALKSGYYSGITKIKRCEALLWRWCEWARMHGHHEHAEGIYKDSKEEIKKAKVH